MGFHKIEIAIRPDCGPLKTRIMTAIPTIEACASSNGVNTGTPKMGTHMASILSSIFELMHGKGLFLP